ncbi:MAG: hypothetical protein AAGA97_13085, partial [Pseudomonadota bacterium]
SKLAFGQCASARVSYMESTRAKAQQNSTQMAPFYSGAWTNFAPGLTEPKVLDAAQCTNVRFPRRSDPKRG